MGVPFGGKAWSRIPFCPPLLTYSRLEPPLSGCKENCVVSKGNVTNQQPSKVENLLYHFEHFLQKILDESSCHRFRNKTIYRAYDSMAHILPDMPRLEGTQRRGMSGKTIISENNSKLSDFVPLTRGAPPPPPPHKLHVLFAQFKFTRIISRKVHGMGVQ